MTTFSLTLVFSFYIYLCKLCPCTSLNRVPSPITSFIPIFSIFWQETIQRLVVNSAHWTKILLTTHLGTGSIFWFFTEKILWIISLILKISSLLPPGSFGGPDANLKLDIMKLDSHITIIKCIIFVFSDTLKIYVKKSSSSWSWLLSSSS